MPEIVNGITVPSDGDPVALPANLRTFAEDVGTAAADAGAAAAVGYASSLDDTKMRTVLDDEDGAFRSGLTAQIGEMAALQGAGAQRFVSKVAAGSSTAVGIAGDSTGDVPEEWPAMALAAFVRQFPRVSLDYYPRSGDAYGAAVPMLTGIASRSVLVRDDFDRTSADLIGSNPNVGGAWIASGTAAGDWTVANGVCSATEDTSRGWAYQTIPANTDVEVSIRLHLPVDPAGRTFRLTTRRVNDNNLLRVDVLRANSGTYRIILVKAIGGTQTQIASSNFSTSTSSETLEVTARAVEMRDGGGDLIGLRFTASINGVYTGATLDASDAAAVLASTTAGFGGSPLGGTTIDQFQIDGLTDVVSPATVAVYNGSLAASTLANQQDRVATLYPAATPLDLVLINSCHNYGGSTPAQYVAAVDAFVTALRGQQPTAGIAIASQNPRLAPAVSIAAHAARQAVMPEYARARGFGYIPTSEAFGTLYDGGASVTNPDGVHPLSGWDSGAGVEGKAALVYLNRLAGLPA